MAPTSRKLVAVEASEDEKRARDELAHTAWGERLSVAEFLRREEQLRWTGFARAAMRSWLLIEEGDPARRVYASLETFRVPSRHGMRPGCSFEIASVFTEPALRGAGLASRLLDEVAARCAEERGAQAMTLYSDVGASIYRRAGYHERPAFDWLLPGGRCTTPAVERTESQDAVAAVLAAHPSRGRFALLPSALQVDWHRERERIYARLLGASPVEHGVLACAEGHALLAGDLKKERLVVLSFFARTSSTAEALLAACADEAARASLSEVCLWAAPEPEDERAIAEVAPWIGARRVAREGSLPMLRPLTGARGLSAEAWRSVERVHWV